MAVEKGPTVCGVKLETEQFNPLFIGGLLCLAKVITTFKPLEIQGSLPKGGVLVVSNHATALDGILLPIAISRQTGRSSHMVARDNLLDPSIEEEAEVLERTGKKTDWLNKTTAANTDPIGQLKTGFKTFLRDRLAWALQHGGVLSIHRGKPAKQQIDMIKQTLTEGRIVGMFIQETRASTLVRPMDGAAIIVRSLSLAGIDIPVVGAYIAVPKFHPRNPFEPFSVSFGPARTWPEFRQQAQATDPSCIVTARGLTRALVDDIKNLASA